MKDKTNARYPHPPGISRIAYSPDGEYLFSVGSNCLIRKFSVPNDPAEPVTLEGHEEAIVGVSASKSHFATCSEDGTVNLYDLATNEFLGCVARSPSAIREAKFSPDGQWIAVCGNDATVKVINVVDIVRMMELECPPVKHVSFHPSGLMLAVSCLNGDVLFYSLSSEQSPQLVHTLENIVPTIKDAADDRTSCVAWHPDGQCFAVPTKSFEIAVFSRSTWIEYRRFRTNGHTNAITHLDWSANGRYLMSTSLDNKILQWDAKTLGVVAKLDVDRPLMALWHPIRNEMAYITHQGQMMCFLEVIPASKPSQLGDVEVFELDKNGSTVRPKKDDEDFDLSLAPIDGDYEEPENWIEDDDGAGYVDTNGKRTLNGTSSAAKRAKTESIVVKTVNAFQPGSTPWRNGRRYLCMNTIGYAWSVEQESHHTVTVSFFDLGVHREYHFTDYVSYDLASLSAEACLFASTTTGKILLRFHDGFSDNWEYSVAEGDGVRAVSLSDSVVVVCTKLGYVRSFNIYGTPLAVHRQSRDPVVACSSWKNLTMIVRSRLDGSLTYSLEDTKSNYIYQKEDAVDVSVDNSLVSTFFSEDGDPCIYDSSGVLLMLLRWREPLQAQWVPILDGRQLAKDQGRTETYWPIGVIQDKFLCTILKGGDKHPSLPLPVTSEFDLSVPVDASTTDQERELLTNRFVLEATRDRASGEGKESDLHEDVSKLELELDKILLRLLQASCKENRLPKAVAIAAQINKDQALEAASKIALRMDQTNVAEKINDLLARRRRG